MRGDHDVDDLVDVIEGNRIYTPCLYVLNKIDQITLEELEVIDRMANYVPICAYLEWNLDGLLEDIWERLDLVRCTCSPYAWLAWPHVHVLLLLLRCFLAFEHLEKRSGT